MVARGWEKRMHFLACSELLFGLVKMFNVWTVPMASNIVSVSRDIELCTYK